MDRIENTCPTLFQGNIVTASKIGLGRSVTILANSSTHTLITEQVSIAESFRFVFGKSAV
jgi:hypothetical protein